ncbi:MAG: hypothetical protein K0S96_1875, partial [Geminicoccaceae bacterium]|nr:hypothetical protein [Geminicoccaceae bacterium]
VAGDHLGRQIGELVAECHELVRDFRGHGQGSPAAQPPSGSGSGLSASERR